MKFANITEETCTGTGATLALAGVTTGNIAFSETYADGDAVPYVVEDSGGSVVVAGVGTYVSATDDITRNDTWNFNGTVIDDGPSTNITLSGGTHTVRCDQIATSIVNHFQRSMESGRFFGPHNLVYDRNDGTPGGEFTAAADSITIITAKFYHPVIITQVGATISTASAGGNIRIGLWEINPDSTVGPLILDSGNISTTSTGDIFNTLGAPVNLAAGVYYMGNIADNTVVRGRGARTAGSYPNGGLQGITTAGGAELRNKYAFTFAALSGATLTTPTGTTDLACIEGIFK